MRTARSLTASRSIGGGMHGRGHGWWEGVCMAGCTWRGRAWWGGMHGGGVCMAGGVWHTCPPHPRGQNSWYTLVKTFGSTRLHSSWMRTTHALTISPSMLCTGEGGVPGLGGSSPRGYLVPWGSLPRGLPGPGGSPPGGWYPSMHWGRPPPPTLTESQTPVKI